MRNTLPGFIVVTLCSALQLFTAPKKDNREYYRVTIYHFKSPEQKQEIDNYLENAWLPALHRSGIKNIGVFTPIANDTTADKRVYIIIPIKNLQSVADITAKLSKDQTYQETAKKYMDALYNNPPFTRIENLILYAFPEAPTMNLPKLNSPKADRVYEYRSYESPTEKLFRNKVRMFNEGGEV